METTFVRDLKQRLDAARIQLKEVSTRRQAIMVEESNLQQMIRAMEVLLKAEEKVSSGSVSPASLPVTGAVTVSPPIPAINSIKSEQSISRFIADFIAIRNGDGTTHKEIAETLVASGYRCHRNYPYVVVSKLKNEGTVVEREGKLFWKQSEK